MGGTLENNLRSRPRFAGPWPSSDEGSDLLAPNTGVAVAVGGAAGLLAPNWNGAGAATCGVELAGLLDPNVLAPNPVKRKIDC